MANAPADPPSAVGQHSPTIALEYRRLRAPSENGAVLIEPPLDEAPSLVAAGIARRDYCHCDVQGRCLADLAKQARGEFVSAAVAYTRQYRDITAAVPATAGATPRIYLAGHQPQLFHPGVWLKNFALGKLAHEQGAVAVNLVIDSDTLKEPAVRVPSGTRAQPAAPLVAYDDPTAEIPYERRTIQNRELFTSFGSRATEAIRPFVRNPLLERYWPLALERSRHTDNLGACLAQSRHQLEGEWGLNTLELPQSGICDLVPFHWFVAHLTAQLPRFWEIYNDSVAQYRRMHGLRSANHPVPDLQRADDWLEAPFWIWTDSEPRRRRLFVCHRRNEILLTDRKGLMVHVPMTAGGDASRAVEVLAELPNQGIRIRTRALGTTLFARLFLSDLFLHGIGGGKYDQLTDLLIRRFYQVEPPPFMVLSGTLRIPVERERVQPDDLRRVEQELREMEFHPEKFLQGDTLDAARQWVETKWNWIRTPVTAETARPRWREIRRANEELQSFIEPERRRQLDRRERAAERLQAELILAWREFAFCLYPATTLRDFLLAFMPRQA